MYRTYVSILYEVLFLRLIVMGGCGDIIHVGTFELDLEWVGKERVKP